MGKPKKATATTIGENYNWGDFGSANAGGVSLSPTTTQNVRNTQSGIGQYLNELINPSYNSQSFQAQQALLDADNAQYANQLGAAAIARGARGSATQNILNSIAANRNNDMRTAMTQEDARVQNILSALSDIESNYFNQTNTMANNILSRQTANQQAKNAMAQYNTSAYNNWKNNLISGAAGLVGTIGGAALLGPLGGVAGSAMTTPYGSAIDPNQVASANNLFQPY